ncbi:hypothetical protein U1Q18_005733 [Sarracenia purpurea var. burkii]
MRNYCGCGGAESGMRAENSDLQREREEARIEKLKSKNSDRRGYRRRGGAQYNGEQRRGALAPEVVATVDGGEELSATASSGEVRWRRR